MAEIPIGAKVRSFHFPMVGRAQPLEGRKACYIEGVVEGILIRGEISQEAGLIFTDCDRYVIRMTRNVFGGNDSPEGVGELAFPPVNGRTIAGEAVPDGVALIEPAESAQ